ncbi:hypothetical protein EKD16_25135 (plasmid) [Streptomonospora litoralis]|uniref:Holin n=2 Tax=Streptomonospora litoralis TaxID=2498135 RepID=A0A4P6Q7J3_9ACTN|nr:hypothetical protein EKD16_25135 [Streptomonospora litoralis]
MFRIFGRDPALWLGALRAGLYALTVFALPLSEAQTAAIMAAVAAAVGIWEAWAVAKDRLVPAIKGFAEALLVLLLAFGVDLSEAQTAAAMGVVTTALALWTRTQVTAAVDADGHQVPKQRVFSLAT